MVPCKNLNNLIGMNNKKDYCVGMNLIIDSVDLIKLYQ